MSVSLLLGLVYLISELLLTYSTSSRHGGQAKAGFDAPLAQPLATASKLEAGSQYGARRGRRIAPWLQRKRRRYACLYSLFSSMHRKRLTDRQKGGCKKRSNPDKMLRARAR